MAGKLNIAFLAAFVIASSIYSSAAQTTYTVGGTTGWTIPTGGATFYSSWAANQTFASGDILVFNFQNNQHDVAEVTKADYDACTSTNPISVATTSPARITINSTGAHYFICNFTGHCAAGQKLMINVTAPTTTPAPAPQPSSPSPAPQTSTPTPVSAPSPAQVSAPTPSSTATPPTPNTGAIPPTTSTSPPSPTTPSSPSPAGTTAPPPPDSSAKSLGVAGLSATFLAVAVAFLY